jgi:hypothetical protein
MKQNDDKQNDDLIIKGEKKKGEREWNKSKQTGVTRVTTIVLKLSAKAKYYTFALGDHFAL